MSPFIRLLAVFLATFVASCTAPGDPDFAPRLAGGEHEAVVVETTQGAFTALLYPRNAPLTVERYREYFETGYFDGRSFGRVVPGFVIQVTDRLLGLTEDDRTVPLEPSGLYAFSAGALGIARASSPNSGGPEFFVMDFASGHLNGQYTVFGQVIEGMDTVRRIARVPAIDWGETTGQAPVLFDRWAIEPVEIVSAALSTVRLSDAEAARYPLRTAERERTDCCAHNLEWPATLAVGVDTDFVWYLTVFDDSGPAPAAEQLLVRLPGGAQVAVQGDPDVAGIYAFRWTPERAGEHALSLMQGDQVLASLQVRVVR